MQAAHDAARGRYDRVRAAEAEAARAAFKGRYDDLRAAEPPTETERAFMAGAARSTEPLAQHFDRDAVNAAWAEQVAAAGIEHEATQAKVERTIPDPATGPREEIRAAWREAAREAVQPRETARAPEDRTADAMPPTARESRANVREAGEVAERALGGIFSGLAKGLVSLIAGIAESLFPTAPPTPDQAQRNARAAEEERQQAAD